MPTFAYKGKDADGSSRAGTLLAENKRTALRMLEDMRVFPLEVEEKAAERGTAGVLGGRDRVKADEVTDFLHQLADLLAVGVPFDRAMDVMLREAGRPPYVRLLSEIRSDVGSGASLSTAMARHSEIFDELYVSMVSAGEEGGFLPDCLRRIAELREKRKELAGRITAAMVYPAVLALFGVATIAYLMVFFIPRFTKIFQDMGAAMPASTEIVIRSSQFVSGNWYWVAGAVAGAVVFGKRWLSTETGATARDRAMLRMPYLREVVTHTSLSRFTRTLGTLLGAGVAILKSLEISEGAAGNRIFRRQIADAALRVKEGSGLAEGLARAENFPGLLREKIAVGEETGKLPEVLVACAEQYEKSLDRSVKLFVAVFEPALIFLMAGIVGFIVISMLLPIFTMNSMVQ